MSFTSLTVISTTVLHIELASCNPGRACDRKGVNMNSHTFMDWTLYTKSGQQQNKFDIGGMFQTADFFGLST